MTLRQRGPILEGSNMVSHLTLQPKKLLSVSQVEKQRYCRTGYAPTLVPKAAQSRCTTVLVFSRLKGRARMQSRSRMCVHYSTAVQSRFHRGDPAPEAFETFGVWSRKGGGIFFWENMCSQNKYARARPNGRVGPCYFFPK